MKSRLIVLTDISNGIENDDIASLARLLLYSNEIDIEGLIAVTSCWVKKGGRQKEKDIILKTIQAYEKVKTNLDIHQAGFPCPDYLRSITCQGIPKYAKALGDGFGEEALNENAGVNKIIEAAFKDDARPLWIAVWGGANTLAQAVWKVQQTSTKEMFEYFLSKIRIHAISDQDAGGHWLRKEFGDKLFYIVSPSPATGSKYYFHAAWPGISADRATHGSQDGVRNKGFSGANAELISKKWLKHHLRSHGTYGKRYPLPRFIMEGDTPSFLGLIPNGLNDPEHPSYGGWGGRYEHYIPESDYTGTTEIHPIWTNASDSVIGMDGRVHRSSQATIWRWREAFQHDFAARMDWTMTPRFEDANHPPVARLAHANRVRVKSGERVTLSAKDSYDEGGSRLQFKWFVYKEAGTCQAKIEIENENSPEASFYAPDVSDVEYIHIILALVNEGTPPLTNYQRVIIQVEKRYEGCNCFNTAAL